MRVIGRQDEAGDVDLPQGSRVCGVQLYQYLICNAESQVLEVCQTEAEDDLIAVEKARTQFSLSVAKPLIEVWRDGQIVGRAHVQEGPHWQTIVPFRERT